MPSSEAVFNGSNMSNNVGKSNQSWGEYFFGFFGAPNQEQKEDSSKSNTEIESSVDNVDENLVNTCETDSSSSVVFQVLSGGDSDDRLCTPSLPSLPRPTSTSSSMPGLEPAVDADSLISPTPADSQIAKDSPPVVVSPASVSPVLTPVAPVAGAVKVVGENPQRKRNSGRKKKRRR